MHTLFSFAGLAALIFARSNAIAFYARTRVFVDERVRGGILMSLRAMSYRGPDYIPSFYSGGVPFSTSQVLLKSHRFKMKRIDAAAYPAQVVQLQPFRDLADQQLVAESMSLETDRMAIHSVEEYSVATYVQGSRPKPASSGWLRRYILPELLFSVTLGSSHSILLKSFWSGLHDVVSVVAARSYFTHIWEGSF
jgi:hypothetical protein